MSIFFERFQKFAWLTEGYTETLHSTKIHLEFDLPAFERNSPRIAPTGASPPLRLAGMIGRNNECRTTMKTAHEGSEMGFLVKSTVWLGLVMLVVPLDTGLDGAEAVGPLQALGAAREAVGDIGAICERKPEVCETGRAAIRIIAARTREASRLALDYLDETEADAPLTVEEASLLPLPDEAPTPDGVVTGSVPPGN